MRYIALRPSVDSNTSATALPMDAALTILLLLMTPVYVALIGLEFTSILFIPPLAFARLIESAMAVKRGSEHSPAGAES